MEIERDSLSFHSSSLINCSEGEGGKGTVNVRVGFFGESYFHVRESIKATFVF